MSSTPHIGEFQPVIPYQRQVIEDIYYSHDYGLGTHEILLSGSVGSAKSILMAHVLLRHCIENPRARVLLGRKALPDLKATIYQKILEHLEGSCLKEGTDYFPTDNIAMIRFRNGSEIISRSWADKKYKKVRSLELSMAVIEELTENNDQDKEAYEEIKMRVGRLPHIKTPIIIAATNPDAPSHWAYKYFIASDKATRHVYYSVTTDNPFLPPQYIAQLQEDLDPKMADRMIRGRWIEIAQEVVYHQYNREAQWRAHSYQVNPDLEVWLTWDFNIGHGKPMSVAAMQYDSERDEFHIFNEVVLQGSRTVDTIEELHGKGLLRPDWRYCISGDATGSSRDTRSSRSDYDIIRKELGNRGLRFRYCVPAANPAIRVRHNTVNSYCLNDLGRRRLFVYKDAPTCDEGLRLTQLKERASYIEDDSKSYQHITTAIGYCIMYVDMTRRRTKQGTLEL